MQAPQSPFATARAPLALQPQLQPPSNFARAGPWNGAQLLPPQPSRPSGPLPMQAGASGGDCPTTQVLTRRPGLGALTTTQPVNANGGTRSLLGEAPEDDVVTERLLRELSEAPWPFSSISGTQLLDMAGPGNAWMQCAGLPQLPTLSPTLLPAMAPGFPAPPPQQQHLLHSPSAALPSGANGGSAAGAAALRSPSLGGGPYVTLALQSSAGAVATASPAPMSQAPVPSPQLALLPWPARRDWVESAASGCAAPQGYGTPQVRLTLGSSAVAGGGGLGMGVGGGGGGFVRAANLLSVASCGPAVTLASAGPAAAAATAAAAAAAADARLDAMAIVSLPPIPPLPPCCIPQLPPQAQLAYPTSATGGEGAAMVALGVCAFLPPSSEPVEQGPAAFPPFAGWASAFGDMDEGVEGELMDDSDVEAMTAPGAGTWSTCSSGGGGAAAAAAGGSAAASMPAFGSDVGAPASGAAAVPPAASGSAAGGGGGASGAVGRGRPSSRASGPELMALLRRVFDLPTAEAARSLGISTTELKRRCRQLGIRRWPQRKLQSLKRILEAAETDEQAPAEARRAVQERVDRNRAEIFQDPDAPLATSLLSLRQSQYKQAHDRRVLPPTRTRDAAGGGSGGSDSGGDE